MGRHTCLFDLHVALGARMVDFGGWDMPVAYGSQIEDHLAVRDAPSTEKSLTRRGLVRLVPAAAVDQHVLNEVRREAQAQAGAAAEPRSRRRWARRQCGR